MTSEKKTTTLDAGVECILDDAIIAMEQLLQIYIGMSPEEANTAIVQLLQEAQVRLRQQYEKEQS